jgi:UDP-N-acetylglucosamine 2-epimerase (non-hydrolysing)
VIARRMGIPVYHMEAGNRCFDVNVPEEINRRVIDHTSDFNLVYTEHARRNLLAEGIHPRRIYLTGSPMREVIDANREAISRSNVLERLGVSPRGFFLASMHRAENVDVEPNLVRLLEALERLAGEHQLPVIVSTHPRTQQRLQALKVASSAALRFLPPFGYHDYMRLQTEAFCTLSDSGTISEESAILGFPAVTMRNAMERPEAMDSGHIVLTGLSVDTIVGAVQFVTQQVDESRGYAIPEAYAVRNTAARVVKLILGTAKLGRAWDGMLAA